jgi:hypothetical protein
MSKQIVPFWETELPPLPPSTPPHILAYQAEQYAKFAESFVSVDLQTGEVTPIPAEIPKPPYKPNRRPVVVLPKRSSEFSLPRTTFGGRQALNHGYSSLTSLSVLLGQSHGEACL